MPLEYPEIKLVITKRDIKAPKADCIFLEFFFHLFYWYLFYIFLPEKSSYQKSQICIRNLRLRVYNLVNSGIWVFCFWGGINLHAQFLWVFPVCCFSSSFGPSPLVFHTSSLINLFPSLIYSLVRFSPGGSDGTESAMQETWVWFLGWDDPLEIWMATQSSILA